MDNILIKERYRIIQKVGHGGMAKVYKAQDILLQRTVAIKILNDQFAEDKEFLNKFNNEAKSAAQLSHVNIVNVYDIGEDIVNGKKIYFIVMEYIEGKTLKDYINEKKQLSNEEIIDFSIQIANALRCAHQSNIIHRDIKPQNILIDRNSLLKVTDFGIARVSTSTTITYTSSILGTVHYISPEQAKGRFVDYRSDLYSLGVVMYEMATGQIPFDADNSVSIAVMHIQERPEEPKFINPMLDEKLNYIIMKLLNKEPSERYISADDLIGELESPNNIISNPEVDKTATVKIQKVEDSKNTKSVYIQNQQSKTNDKRRSKKIYVLLFLILLLLIPAIYFVYSSFKNNSDYRVTVPSVVDINIDKAIEMLESKGFKTNIKEYKESVNIEKDNVISQSPEAGEKVKEHDVIDLVVSKGKQVEVPYITGKTVEEAEEILKRVGLKLGKVESEYNPDIQKNLIYQQKPKSGKKMKIDSPVDVVVSLGSNEEEQQIFVPYLYNMAKDDAVTTINNYELNVGNFYEDYSNEVPSGHVMGQSIAADTAVDKYSTIDLTISLGPKNDNNDGDKINAVFELEVGNRENFNVRIVKLNDNMQETEVIYDKNHHASEVNNGYLDIKVLSSVGDNVNVYIDEELIGRYEVKR